MIKEMAWNTFKNTGNINTYLELKQIPDLEKTLNENSKQTQIINQNQKIGE